MEVTGQVASPLGCKQDPLGVAGRSPEPISAGKLFGELPLNAADPLEVSVLKRSVCGPSIAVIWEQEKRKCSGPGRAAPCPVTLLCGPLMSRLIAMPACKGNVHGAQLQNHKQGSEGWVCS